MEGIFNPVEMLTQQLESLVGVEFCFVKFVTNYRKLDSCDECNGSWEPLPMSLSIYVKGGDDVEVAKTIAEWKPIGLFLNGDFEVITDYHITVRWYNLNYSDYTEQKRVQNKVNKRLEKEQLLKRLAELEQEGE